MGHLDPDFLEVLDRCCDRLRAVFRTSNQLTFPVSGTGSAGMEAAFVNLVRPGDVVVVGVNGLFGERMCDVARRCGAEVVRVEAPWGEPLDPQALVDAHPSPAMVAVVHAETSTGVRNDVGCLRAGLPDESLLLVDCVTSLAGIPVEVDAWGADVAYAGTQKCLGVPPGLAPITFSERALDRLVRPCRSWYLDVDMIRAYVTGGAKRAYHHTAPVAMVQSLDAALGVILEEGLQQVWERHRRCGEMLREGLEALGLELLVRDGHALPQLTSVVVPEDLPEGLDEAGVRAALLERSGIEIGGGLGPLAGRIWRIGCMGHTARERNVHALLGALAEIFGRRMS